MPAGVTIFMTGYEIAMSVGIYPEERARHQRVIVDVEADCAVDPAQADDIATTVSYETFIKTAQRLAAGKHYNLVETFAGELADELLKDLRIRRIRVRCSKPDIFRGNPQSVGAEVVRDNMQG